MCSDLYCTYNVFMITCTIDNRVGKGLETAWASNNFTRIFNGERCCKMTQPARRTREVVNIAIYH